VNGENMAGKPLLDELQNGKTFVLDGELGTNMQLHGLPAGKLNEEWVLENPEIPLKIHSSFAEAGSDILLTMTFCANPIHLSDTPFANRTKEINFKAVDLVKKAANGKGILIAGSLGPIGKLMAPYGPLEANDFYTSFAEQAKYLAEAGVDLLVLETFYSIEEGTEALKGIRSVSDLPLIISFSFDRGTRTMMGAKPGTVAQIFADLGADVIGINCGKGLDENTECLKLMRDATTLPLWFKPNAGKPEIGPDGKTYYHVSPEEIASRVPEWLAIGAQLIGCCCGSTAEHIQAVASVVKNA